MAHLMPADACRLADASYATLGSSHPKIAAAAAAGASRDLFDIAGGTVFTGSSGVDSVTNFGFIAFGKSASHQGECLVAVRGTQTVPDGLTDAYMAGDRGPSGLPVHRGFNRLANSILPQLRAALRGRNPSAIHFVGHSLGGATAVLLADALHGVASANLYTFGAPRAGTQVHSEFLTSAIGAGNIFRVYHDTDPVPMVPIYPFTHVPANRRGYLLAGSGAIVWPAAHSLALYQRNIGSGNWSGLPTLPHRRFSLDTVDDVLARAGAIPGGFMSSVLMRLIVKVLGMILEAAGMVIGSGLFVLATVLDQIAYLLIRGAHLIGAGIDLLQSLVEQIMRFLGIAVRGTVNVSQAFLRWLLNRLFSVISAMAVNAISRVI